jgi:serine/threonine protein kinase
MFPQIFGKYVLEREIAAGGMARVYLATLRGAVGFEKRLVVKQIRSELASDEGFVQRFVEEAKTAVELSHPNIVPVYELGVEQGIYYMAMEFCEGLTLAEILSETGPLDAEEGAYVGVEICRALDYAHRRAGIVHRDVTPRNVLIDDEGAVRLIDFGIAAPAAREDEPGEAAREVFGSPGHMPPEQLRGDRLTPSTDVFAVGVLLIEAWTGRPPFRRPSFAESAEALKSTPEAIDRYCPGLSPIADLIRSAIALDPKNRPEQAEALSRPLRDFLRGADSGDIARRLGQRVRRARRRSQSSVPWLVGEISSSGPLTPALIPLTPTGASPVTRTFAARDDLVEWTRRLSSSPPEASKASGNVSPTAAPEPGSGSPRTSVPPREARPRQTALLGLAALGLAGALGVALAGSRSASERLPSPAPVTASAAVSVEQRAAPAELRALAEVAPPLPEPPALHSVRRSPAATPRPSSAVAAVSVANSEAETSSTLKLTSDLPAVVTVQGERVAETRPTPVRALRIPSGSYTVTFSSDTYSAPIATRITLEPGTMRSVHADFRDAVPRVNVR